MNFKKTLREVKNRITHSEPFAAVLKNAIWKSLDTLFLLLGIVTIFLIITNLITKVIPLTIEQKTLLSGILEMTQGVKGASTLNIAFLDKALLMLAFISFGGLSVHTQILSIMAEYKISYWNFLKARVLHVMISCTFFFCLAART